MPSYAENPDTGERLVLQGESWVPVQRAVNPTTGETLELFNDQWVAPVSKMQASTPVVMGAPAEGLPEAPPPDRAIPPQNETMWQGVKRLVGSGIQQDPIYRSAVAGAGQVATELVPGSVETAGKLVRAAGQIGSALYQGDIARAQAMAPSSEYDPFKVAESMKPAERAISVEGKKVQAVGERGRKTMEAKLPQNAEGARYVGGIVGKFAQLAALSAATGPFSGVVAPVTLGSEAGVNAYDKAIAEGYSDTKARQVAILQGGLNTLLMGAGGSMLGKLSEAVKVPGVGQGVTDTLLKAVFLKAPALAATQTIGDKTIDKMILDKKTTLSETIDTFLEHYKNFAAFEALGAVQQVPRLLGTRDAYIELGKKYASADDAKVSLTMEAMRALQGEATPESVARLDSARSTLAAIEQAEKAGRKIKWTGKIETMEVVNVPETRTQQEGNQPEYRGGDQVSQGDGQIREPARLPEEVAPVDQSSGVPVGERPQEAQAKAEEVVNPENSVSYDDLPRERKMEIVGSIENELQGYMDDPASFQRAYTENPKSRGGRIVNGDIGYDLIPTIARDQVSGRAALKDVDSGVLSYMMTLMRGVRAAAIEAAGDRPVGITAGSQASGKTELANKLIENGTLGAVIDAPHNDAATLDYMAKEIRSRGKEVELFFVDRANFGETFKSMIRRAIKEGRTVPLSEMVHNRDAVPNAVLKFGEVNRGLADTGVNHVRSLESPKGERPRYEGYGGRLFENIPWDMRPEDIPVSGQDALERIRERTGEGRENLEKQALDAYTDYLEGVARGDEPAIPSDIRKELEADLRGNLPSEQTIPRRHERPDRGIPERDGRSVLAGQSGTAEGLSGAPPPERRLATTGAVTPPLAPRASAPPVPAAPAQAVAPKRPETQVRSSDEIAADIDKIYDEQISRGERTSKNFWKQYDPSSDAIFKSDPDYAPAPERLLRLEKELEEAGARELGQNESIVRSELREGGFTEQETDALVSLTGLDDKSALAQGVINSNGGRLFFQDKSGGEKLLAIYSKLTGIRGNASDELIVPRDFLERGDYNIGIMRDSVRAMSLLGKSLGGESPYLEGLERVSSSKEWNDVHRAIVEEIIFPSLEGNESIREIGERSVAKIIGQSTPALSVAPSRAATPESLGDTASAIFGGTQVPKVDTEAVRNSVREVFPGKDDTSKAIRHALYKREGFLRSNPTPEEILAAGEQIRNNPLLRRRKEAGAIDLPDVDVAMGGVVKRLFPDRDAADPPLTQEQVIQKARDAAKKQTPPIDLSKVDLNEGINGVLADWYLKAHGAGIGEDGVPIIGGSLFPAEKAAMPTRDATAIEHSMRLIDNPAALWEGGVDTLKDPLFRPGTSPVADAAFANSRAMILKQNLVDWTQTLLAPIPAHSKEVEKAVAPIFDRYMRKRARQMALEKQLGRRLEIRALERDRSKLDAKFRKATQEQVRDIVPPAGVEGESQAESRDHRKGSRAATIIGLKTKIDEIDKKIAKIKKDKKGMPILDNPSATMAKYELLETQLERDRKALDATTARLGTKFGDVRIAVAASVGARPDAYPEWLTASIRPHEQRIAELTRKFYDDAALPAMEREGIPGRPGENFLHQPTSRLVSAAKGKLGAIIDSKRPEHYMEASMNPESIRFHHKEDNALLWFPSAHASLESYVDTFPSILAKRELANRWDKAVTEMRAGGQPRLAGDVEEFLNNYLHGAKRHAVIDAMMGWFYWKNLALNPSPALLHAVKQFLNWAEIGPIATMKGYKNVAQQVVPGEGGRLRREGFKTWMGAKGGVAAIEQGAGIEAPFSKGGAVRKGLRKLGAAPIGQVEAIDRNVTFMGALEMAKAQGLSNEQALQVAMGSTLAINFLGVDRAAMYRGSVGNAVFAFMGAPTKLTDFGRRRAMDVLREFVKASRGIKSGEGVRGFTPRTGKPWLPKGGPEGESWRKMQASATYAITIAMAGYLGKELFNTNRLQQGILHLPKLLKVVGAFVTGDTEHIYGATADLAPAITQAMDNIEKYGLGMGLVHTAMPTVLDKALRGSPNRKKQPQWGGPDRERATRYLLGTPKADVQERMDRKAAFKKAMQQKRNRETWKREHSWLKRQLSEVVD